MGSLALREGTHGFSPASPAWMIKLPFIHLCLPFPCCTAHPPRSMGSGLVQCTVHLNAQIRGQALSGTQSHPSPTTETH